MLIAENHGSTAGTDYLAALPTEVRRRNGQVYTPPHLVSFVLERAGFQGTGPLLDPSCGAGAFLDGAVPLIARASIGRGRSRLEFLAQVERELFGVDVDVKACALAIETVQRAVKRASPGPIKSSFFASNVSQADFLLGTTASIARQTAFAFVVGNPPYVAVTRLDEQQKARLRQRYTTASGRMDLYTLFFERALELLTSDGKVAFITPDKYLVSQTAQALRSMFLENGSIESISRFASHKVFSGAATVPCITVFQRGPRRKDTEILDCEDNAADGSVQVTARAVVAQSTLTSKPWYLSTSGGVSLARKIQGKHPRLAQFTVRVSAGPATGRDGVFVLPAHEANEIEPKLLRPAVRGRDIRAYAIDDPGLRVLTPFSYTDAEAELVRLADYPGAARYLARHKRDLQSRHCVRVWEKTWYDFHDSPTGDLAKQPKILVPDVAASNRFAVDTGHYFPLHSVYYLSARAGVDPFFLVGILNSQVASYLIRVFSPVVKDGFNRYRQQFLAEIPIPLASESARNAIADAARCGDGPLVDRLVNELFGLSSADERHVRSLLGAVR